MNKLKGLTNKILASQQDDEGKSSNNNTKNIVMQSEENYHMLELPDMARLFNTSLTDGLKSTVASQYLLKNGRNVIKQKTQHPILRFISYFFTGFCSLIWVAALICILAWQPLGSIGSDEPQIVNLALGVLLIIVILLQAAFTAFQDWQSGKVMKSIKV
jgi:sodium/potassium-transporting ATPase subunit alpha